MARAIAELPKGTRITDYISLGVITKTFPIGKIKVVLEQAGKLSQRNRDLPSHVVVYYVIALALYMDTSYREVLRCLLEGLQWLKGPGFPLRITGKSGISQARSRLGASVLRQLYEELVKPVAIQKTKGAWYKHWRLVSIDGSTLDVADTSPNRESFGRPGVNRGRAAYPQIRFVSLVENGTHVLFGAKMSGYGTGEITLAKEVVQHLESGFLCLADRNFFGFELWQRACLTGADLLWRVKKNLVLPCEKRFKDGSYLSRIYPSIKDRRHHTSGVTVRVIEYTLQGIAGAEDMYRLISTIVNPDKAPARELAALYQERWEIETALDELKTHLRGARIVLRSKSDELVRQEFYGLLMAHFAIRGLMHEAALKETNDPDRLSLIHAVRVIRRKMPHYVAIPPRGPESLS